MDEASVRAFKDEMVRWRTSLREEIKGLVVCRKEDDPLFIVDRFENGGEVTMLVSSSGDFKYFCYGCGKYVQAIDYHKCENTKLMLKVRLLEKIKKSLVSLDILIQILRLEE